MSEDPRPPRKDSMPALVWGLLGALVVALFVLILGLLHQPT
jgi:hypothetical protein